MAGLNLGMMGGVRASAGGMSNSPAPATATQAAFGTGGSSGSYPSTAACLAPNDPFGVALWSAILATGVLLLIRHSLPA